MIILGIETSCDETAASVVRGKGDSIEVPAPGEVEVPVPSEVEVLSNVVYSQIKTHQKYGGVVPEVAAREHVVKIIPVIDKSIKAAKIERPDVIAVTVGPGLITSLTVGVETAKTLAFAWDLPLVAVNHIEGHIYANFIGKQNILFPALILTVSGGHTSLVLMRGHGKFQIIGETRDDAAGEAFDKGAKLMDIGYPGGPAVSVYAERGKRKEEKGKSDHKIVFPRPMIDSDNYDFSFSGLKTSLFYHLKKDPDWKKRIPEYCFEYQQAIVDTLAAKTIKAAKKYNVKTVMLTGGVSANKTLRDEMSQAVSKHLPGTVFKVPGLAYTTDNAVMVATAGYFKALAGDFTDWKKAKADSNLEL